MADFTDRDEMKMHAREVPAGLEGVKKYWGAAPYFWSRLFLIGCLGTAMLAACMTVPVSQDDFSGMGNDFFSNLIKKREGGRYDRGDATLGRSYGVSMIDPQEVKKKSEDFFLGKTSTEVMETFKQSQGQCESVSQADRLTCDVVRKWSLKTIGRLGGPTIRKTMVPEVRFLYRFALSETRAIIGIEVEILDLTKFYSNENIN